jgi:hypothetical protein
MKAKYYLVGSDTVFASVYEDEKLGRTVILDGSIPYKDLLNLTILDADGNTGDLELLEYLLDRLPHA